MSDEVQIEEAEAVLKGAYIPWLKEKFPFSKLTNATWQDEAKTKLKGPSFLISRSDNPPSVLAAGRKRFKHCVFISRKVTPEGDIRVWLHPDSPLPTDAPTSAAGKSKAESAAPKKDVPAKKVVQKPKQPAA